MATDRLILDKKDFTTEVQDLGSVVYTYGLNQSNRVVGIASASNLVITGEGASYVRQVFLSDPCRSQEKQIKAEIYDGCCDIWRNLYITYETVGEFCFVDGQCSVTIDLTTINAETRCKKYLDKTIYWKNGYCDNADCLPLVGYAKQPSRTLFRLYEFLETLVNIFSGFGSIIFPLFGAPDLLGPLKRWIAGVGNFGVTTLVADVLEYHANKCGLKFKSSIFSGKYKNLTIFALLHETGQGEYANREEKCSSITANAPAWYVSGLLDRLAKNFNAKWELNNGYLIFERKDYFKKNRRSLGTIETMIETEEIIGDFCIEFIQDNACAVFRGDYQEDGGDTQGNRALHKYNDIIEWNEENSDYKEGICGVSVEFGAAKFMFDRTFTEDYLVLDDLQLDYIRLDLGRTHDLILSGDTHQVPKLLLLEDGFDCNDARVIRGQHTIEIEQNDRIVTTIGDTFGNAFDYNSPMYFSEDYPGGGELYNGFHAIDDPNVNGRDLFKVSEMRVKLTCDLAAKIDENPNGWKFNSKWGNIIFETTSIDCETNTAVFTNGIINC